MAIVELGGDLPGRKGITGKVNNVWGVYQSIDAGTTWTKLNDAAHQWGGATCITGDMRVFGPVYLGASLIFAADEPRRIRGENTKKCPRNSALISFLAAEYRLWIIVDDIKEFSHAARPQGRRRLRNFICFLVILTYRRRNVACSMLISR